jgi:hypothetical protein
MCAVEVARFGGPDVLELRELSRRCPFTCRRPQLPRRRSPWCPGRRRAPTAGTQPPAEIAQSVGLTERTFFRHFSDKREVLFYGQQQFLQAFVDGVKAAPPDASPLEVIASALRAAASLFPDERRPHSRTRQFLIDQNPNCAISSHSCTFAAANRSMCTGSAAVKAGRRQACRSASGAVWPPEAMRRSTQHEGSVQPGACWGGDCRSNVNGI